MELKVYYENNEMVLKFESDCLSYEDGECKILLPEQQQRELVKRIFANKPEIIRDIICEECPKVQKPEVTR